MAARKVKPQPAGPKGLRGSEEAKRKAAVILETLCGLRNTQSASDELGVALVRYYVLETRMLQAMIDALEPKARGRQRSIDATLLQLRDDNQRLEREVLRLQALYRVTQRAVGVRQESRSNGRAKAGKGKPKTQRVRRQSRGERVLKTMRQEAGASESAAATVQGGESNNTDQGGA